MGRTYKYSKGHVMKINDFCFLLQIRLMLYENTENKLVNMMTANDPLNDGLDNYLIF